MASLSTICSIFATAAKHVVIAFRTTMIHVVSRVTAATEPAPLNMDDFVEVGPPLCEHRGEKYYLMYGEEVCRDCGEWTGRTID